LSTFYPKVDHIVLTDVAKGGLPIPLTLVLACSLQTMDQTLLVYLTRMTLAGLTVIVALGWVIGHIAMSAKPSFIHLDKMKNEVDAVEPRGAFMKPPVSSRTWNKSRIGWKRVIQFHFGPTRAQNSGRALRKSDTGNA
jgi:hypothetical protein